MRKIYITLALVVAAFVANAQTWTINGPTAVCAGDQNVSYSVQSSGGGLPGLGSYSWKLNGAVIGTALNPNMDVDIPSTGSTHTLEVNGPNSLYASLTLTNVSGDPGTVTVLESCNGNYISVGVSGNSGTLKWQKKVGSGSWTDFGLGFPDPIGDYNVTAGTTYSYRVRTNSTCATQYSNVVTVTMRNPVTGGTVTGAHHVCYGSSPTQNLTGSGVTGGAGSYQYSWWKRVSGGNWDEIYGGEYLEPNEIGTLYQTTEFKREVTDSQCGTVESLNTVTITVNPIPSQPTTQSILACHSGSATLTATPGTNGNQVRWYTAQTGGSYLGAGNVTVNNITTPTNYWVSTYNTGTTCESSRKQVTVNLHPTANPGTLTGATEAYGIASGWLHMGGTIVGNVVKWQYRTTGNWMDTVVTNTSLEYVNIQTTREYRAVVNNQGCADVPGDIVLVEILDLPTVDLGLQANIRPDGGTTISTDNNHASYQWLKNDVAISGATSHELEVNEPGTYKVTVTSGGGATYTTGDAIIGNQLEMNENMVTTYTYRVATTTADDPFAFTTEQQSVSTQVYDGLGRPIQQVGLNASPQKEDLVVPIEYDEFGRQTKYYLPFVAAPVNSAFKSNALAADYALSDHRGYYMASTHATDKAFSEVVLEASPLSRPVEQGAPGSPWQIGQNTVKFQYAIADSAEVIDWTFESMLTDSKAVYPSGQLYENITEDEDGNQTVEYTDKQGQTILKKSQVDGSTWAETYYIYDVYGQLSVVLPPEATSRLDADFFGQSTQARTSFLNTWAFLYDYDGRNRMTMKKVPGADSVFMVYDQWDRLVLTQDGVQRANNQWLFTKYDQLNRPIITGLATITGTTASIRNAVHASTQRAESFSVSGTNQYTDITYPNNSLTDNYLTITYYDNYDWDNSGVAYTNPVGLTQSTDVKGLVTGTLTKTGNGSWITSASYYDDRYRVIQAVSTNHLGGSDVVTNHYDFIGQVTKSVSSHNDGAKTTEITRTFEYDHAGRLLKTYHELAEDIQWTDLVGVSINGNEVEKTEANGWGTAGAASSQYIKSGQDGKIEFYVAGNDAVMMGFSETNNDAHYNTIDYAIYTNWDWNLHVYENGTYKANVATYASGDVISIERELGTIKYKKNDTLVYTSATLSTGDLLCDVALFGTSNKIKNGKISYESILLSENEYNELGELIEKNLHGGSGSTFAQSLDYAYNIRGWLTSINESDLSGADDDLFGMELLYDSQDGTLNNTQLYNGNISAMKWSDHVSSGANNSRAYNYSYDKLNRLDTASHFQNNVATNKYGVQGLNYDLNGNIESLQRRADNSSAYMDDLSYTYAGNQLQKVSDAASNTTGFHDAYTGAIDYVYDANGNMVKDRNKGIDSIYYNHLNLPVMVDFDTPGDSIRYLYDAAGIKLQQTVYDSGNLVKTTDYVGEFIYEDGEMQLIQHEEGRIVPNVNKTEDIAWTFDTDTEGFIPNYQITSMQQVSPGYLEISFSGNDPYVYTPDNLNLDASKYEKVKVIIENTTSSIYGHVFFTTTTDGVFDYAKHLRFDIQPNSGFTEYIIDISSLPSWQGTIKQFRLDPTSGGPGTLRIDQMLLTGKSELEGYDYQYHLKDHLGNVRMTFSTTPESYTMLATMEYSDEVENFSNYVPDSNPTASNSGTHVSTNSNLVNNGLDLNTFLCVNKGDTIKSSAYAYYNDPGTSYDLVTSTIASTLFTSAFNPNKVAEGVIAEQTDFNDAFGAGTIMGGRSQTTTAPPAFINYIFFDSEMKYITAGFKQITTASNGTSAQVISNDFIPDRDGYLMIYLSNETDGSQLIVSWDDFTVYHGKTNVVSTQDYYPFGLTFNESVRVASSPQRFKFGSKEKDDVTGWTDFGARMYMDDLGRWGVLDAEADRGYHLSPYNYSFNNPMRYTDPDGNWPWDAKSRKVRAARRTARRFARATGGKYSRISKGSSHNFGGAVARVKIAGTVAGDNVVSRYKSRVLKYNRGLTSGEEYDLGFVNFKDGENYGGLFDTSTKYANGAAGAVALALETAVVIGVLPPGVIGVDGKIDLEALTTMLFAQASDNSKNEKHGDAEAVDKVQEQINQLEQDLQNATSKRDKVKIRNKIKNVKNTAKKNKKGEEHSKTKKR